MRARQGIARRARIAEIEPVALIAQPRGDGPRHGDGLPALRQDHQQVQVGERRAQPQPLRDGQRHQHMRGDHRPGAQHVAALRPAAGADQVQVQRLLGGETQLAGDDQRRGIGQRHIAKAQAVGHVSSPAAITNCWAMSATRRFWSIAVLRSRA